MGTSIALGMSPEENILIMPGEVFLVVELSWAFACIIAGISTALCAYSGIPGIMFFPDDRLFLIPDYGAYVKTFFIIVIVNISGAVAGLFLAVLAGAGLNALKLSSADPGLQTVMGGSVFYLGFSWSSVAWIPGGIAAISALTALTSLRSSLNVPPIAAISEIKQ